MFTDFKKANLTVIGAGHVGIILSTFLASKVSTKITLIDTNVEKIQQLIKGYCPVKDAKLELEFNFHYINGKFNFTESYEQLHLADIILVCVGTPLNSLKSPDFTALELVFDQINKKITRETLVILKSTVTPGKTMQLKEKYANNKFLRIAFCPERFAEGTALQDLVNNPLIIGGVDSRSTNWAIKFFEDYGFKTSVAEDSTTAEMVKLVDNTWIDLNIALAQEIASHCELLNIDALEVIKLANTLKKGSSYVNVLTPSVGVGGYCLPKDPWFLDSNAQSLGFDYVLPATARRINENSHITFVNSIISKKEFLGRTLIYGLSFKSNSSDVRNSPALEVYKNLKNHTSELNWFDPLVNVDSIPLELHSNQITSVSKLGKFNTIVICAFHDSENFRKLQDFERILSNGGFIADGRGFFSKQDIINFKNSGFQFYGVGRGI